MKNNDLPEWVFGYGSLMWNPGFEHLSACSAMLEGYHRSFCVYSHHYRGTPDRPGLVLGLDKGGHCEGIAFQVAPENRDIAINYLNERELSGYAYKPAVLEISINSQRVEAYTFVADPDHSLYAGNLAPDRLAELIMNAVGVNGLNRDYLINTVQQLEGRGFTDDSLHALLRKVEILTGLIDQGGGI